MKKPIVLVIIIAGIFLLLFIIFGNDIINRYILKNEFVCVESSSNRHDFYSSKSPTITYLYHEDSTYVKSINWDIAEKIVGDFISFMYINDSCLRKTPDSVLCKELINYYVLNNPTDGYLSETLSITMYDLFYDNDSLCSSLKSYMIQKNITKELCDTIWIRIANDIMGKIIIVIGLK